MTVVSVSTAVAVSVKPAFDSFTASSTNPATFSVDTEADSAW